jgi:predicted permease
MYSPLNGNAWGTGVWVDGKPLPGPHDDNMAFWDRVTPGYFDAIGTRIIEGRGITEQDRADSQRVAVINQAFARKFFEQQDPVGKYFGRTEMQSSRVYVVVGVAENARYVHSAFDKPPGPFFFLAEPQHEVFPNSGKDVDPGSHFLHDIVIVTRPGVRLTTAQVRQAVASVDPNLPIISIQTLAEQVDGQFRQQRLIARLTSFFGILSLVLASIGLYGITAYNAGRRVGEIGVRMALGATRAQVVVLVLRGAFALVAAGLLVGLPLALAAGRFLGSQLYGLNPYDPAVIVAAVLILGFSALVASLIPAVRASLISPSEALRAD